MGNVFQFSPRGERNAKANLEDFIRLAKESLTAFGGRDLWDDDRWEHGETVVVFATITAPLGVYAYTPMAQPFKDFAKAYVRYCYSHNPKKNLGSMIQGLRCIEAGLLAACNSSDITLLNTAILDVCAEECRSFYNSAQVHCNTGRVMETIADFVRKNRLARSLPAWKSPFKKPVILTEDIGLKGKAYRDKKLPTNETMLFVADLFAQATDIDSRYFSSILILLLATPSRISEVLRLAKDCIQWEPDDRGELQMFLRWHAAKGKGATKKWVVPIMREAVQEAVQRLVEIGQPARIAAQFAFENPGHFMLHSNCTDRGRSDDTQALTPEAFCAAIEIKYYVPTRLLDSPKKWSRIQLEKRLRKLVDKGNTSYRDLASYVLETYQGSYWPYIDSERTVKTWNSLCLHRQNEFHKDFLVKCFSWRLPTGNEVNSRLHSNQGRSMFDKRGMKSQDGTSVKITTHQVRHWLSTMSERAGMDEYTLAQWAGRAKVADNRHYDHRTQEERLNSAKALLNIQEMPLLERIKHRQPVTYHELGVDRLGVAKATLYGMCVHDYAMAPCQKQRECMTCKEHVCIKGDHITLDRIRLLEAQTEALFERAKLDHVSGEFGADRWGDNLRWQLAHIRVMRTALEHPQVQVGAILKIPDGHDPSPVRRTLIDLGLVDYPLTATEHSKIMPWILS